MEERDLQAAGESPERAGDTPAPEPENPAVTDSPAAPPEGDATVSSTPEAEDSGESGPSEPDAVAPPSEAAPEDATAPDDSGAAIDAPAVSADELLAGQETAPAAAETQDAELRAVLEALVYVTEEPLSPAQIAGALQQPEDRIRALLGELIAEFDRPEHGIHIKEVASGYKMATKPEHHEAVRAFVKSLKPPLKLSLPALETLAVIAYKQPVTAPEIMEIRGVQGAGVLKTLLDRKLIAVAGRKNVIGKPILYKTTREFLLQFGLKDLAELPSLKEFEEIRRMAFADEPQPPQDAAPPAEPQPEAPAEPLAAGLADAEPEHPAAAAPEPSEAPAQPEESPAPEQERPAPAPEQPES